MIDVCGLGELLIDFTPCGFSEAGGALFERNPGGAVANVLAANSKLGGKTAFIGKVGRDAFGEFLRKTVSTLGVDTAGLVTDTEIPTTLAFVQLDESGDRSFSFYRKPGADMMLRKDEINEETIKNCRIFHFGSVSLTDDPAAEATLYAARAAKAAGALISYDPNYRPLLWNDEKRAVEKMREGLALADIVKVSDEEMKLLTGQDDLKKGAEALASFGASLVFVSMGAKGAFYFNKKASNLLPTYDVATIDTTGAGDAFLGAIHYRIGRMTAAELAALDSDELDDILDFANAAGSLTTTKRGAASALPTLDEIKALRRGTKISD